MSDIVAPRAAGSATSPPAVAAPIAGLGTLLLGLSLATGMEFYTSDSMNLVLPDLAGTLGVSADEASWILTVYSSALFLGVPVSIWMAARCGYKRYLIGTIVAFAAASLGCATAPELDVMLFWRAIQGLAGAGLYVWWRAAIYLLLPRTQRSASLMRVSSALYLSSAFGLLASGYITDEFNWRLIFLPNLIFAAGAVWFIARCFPTLPPATRQPSRTDYVGIGLIAVATVSLQIMLNRGQIDDWFGSAAIQALAWSAAIACILFVFWQTSALNAAPLMRFELLRDRRVMASALIGIFTGVILSGSLYELPEYLRNVDPEPHSATHTGQIMCLYALAAAALRPLVVPLVARFGQRKTIIGALVMLIAAMLLLSRLITTDTPDGVYVLPLILYAFCLSPLLPSVGSGTVARIEQNKLLDGVSIYMTFRQFGASLGVALLTILVDQRESLHSSRLFDHLTATSQMTQDWLAKAAIFIAARGGVSPIDSHRVAARLLAETGARQAATLAYADAFLFMAAVGFVALCLVPIIPPTPVSRQ